MGICDGRVAIVTGGGRGLGRSYALKLAAQGAKVIVNDLGSSVSDEDKNTGAAADVVGEITAAGGQAEANGADVADWGQAQAMVQQAIETFGGLDILITNAGILRDRMLVNMTEEDWDQVIRIHLKGTFAPAHHAAAYWRQESKAGRKRDARLINTTSASGLWNNIAQANYGAAKAGIASFTIIAARELQRIGVAVNAIAPRATSRMTAGLRDEDAESLFRRDPEWTAALVTWLASPAAADITGRVFEAWGHGFSVANNWTHGPRMDATMDPTQIEAGLRHILAAAPLNQHFERDQYLDP